MAYEIVKFTDDSGQSVQITPADVRGTFCPSATDKEIQMFLALCANQHLNPWTKDAYLVKYGGNPASIITSRAAIQKRADSNPDFEGVELGVVVANAQGTVEHRPGEACYKVLGEQLLGGWARAYRKGRKPYYSEVPLAEYSTGKSNWQKMPGTMITKVAEMHALRGAFPQEFQGMYSSEEMDQAQQQPAQQVRATVEATPNPEDIAQLKAMTEELAGMGYDTDATKRYLWGVYKQGGIDAAKKEADGMREAAQQPEEGEQQQEPEQDALLPDDVEF
jgi:phage recombination protein Bet